MTLRTADLPAELVRAIQLNLGVELAGSWLDAAVVAANHCAHVWDVRLDEVLTGGALSLCVAGSSRDGQAVVLKVPADEEVGRREIDALTVWREADVPAILASDRRTGVFLMERIEGTGSYPDPHAVFLLAASLKRAAPSPMSYPPLADNVAMRLGWAEERFASDEHKSQRADLAAARRMVMLLLDSQDEGVLLHGDFQRKNVLVDASGPVAIDPYACIGDATFDPAFWVALASHPRPLMEIYSAYQAPSVAERNRFCLWVWALSVIENRPHLEGASARQDFIESLRDEALRTYALLDAVRSGGRVDSGV